MIHKTAETKSLALFPNDSGSCDVEGQGSTYLFQLAIEKLYCMTVGTNFQICIEFLKIGPSGAHYCFCFILSLIIESYLEYQYTPV